jgi:DNA-binding response OmpR family regulator
MTAHTRTPGTSVRGTPAVLVHGDLRVDRDCFRVTFRDQPVHLGPTPYRLLNFLLRRPGVVYSREKLIAALWPAGTQIRLSTVDVHILRLRAALASVGGADLVVGVRGRGYGLRALPAGTRELPQDRAPAGAMPTREQPSGARASS